MRCSPLVDQGDNDIQFLPGSELPPHFLHWRIPVKEDYIISPEGHEGYLGLRPSKLNLTGIDGNSAIGGQTFVGRRQVDSLFTYRVTLDYSPKSIREEAGITLFLTQVGDRLVQDAYPLNHGRITMPASA